MALIEDAVVTREQDGRLRVTWRTVGECDLVDLAWGRSADGLDHVHLLTVPAGSEEAWIDGEALGPGRRVYVSLAPSGRGDVEAGPGATVAAERRIGMAGPVNFRDLGGYRGRDGRTVRWGLVFRSDALVLHDEDMDGFAELGIRTVYDLRSETERTNVPNRFPAGSEPTAVILPLVSENGDSGVLDELDLSDGESFLEQLYVRMFERSAENFGRVLTGLSRPDELPAVFHCAAGKDRTGMVAALLLSILGVSREDILDDYELTGRYRTTEHVHASMQRLSETGKVAPEVAAGILRTPRWAMESALSAITQKYGDLDGYITGPGGAESGVPDRLREVLLTPSIRRT